MLKDLLVPFIGRPSNPRHLNRNEKPAILPLDILT